MITYLVRSSISTNLESCSMCRSSLSSSSLTNSSFRLSIWPFRSFTTSCIWARFIWPSIFMFNLRRLPSPNPGIPTWGNEIDNCIARLSRRKGKTSHIVFSNSFHAGITTAFSPIALLPWLFHLWEISSSSASPLQAACEPWLAPGRRETQVMLAWTLA